MMHMALVGAASGARPQGLDLLPGKSFYYIGNDPHRWRVSVPQYARVAYRGGWFCRLPAETQTRWQRDCDRLDRRAFEPGNWRGHRRAQVNVLTPLDSSTGLMNIELTNGSNTSDPFTVNFQPVAPAFLKLGGGPYLAAVHADGSLVGPASMSVPGYTFTPARAGETILLFGTGFGLPASPMTEGSAVQLGTLPEQVDLTIGHGAAKVQYAGVVGPGLYQFNVVVPSGNAEDQTAVEGRYSQSAISGGLIALSQ